MGRRKERRIAALATGRRVKLDLFAEPSGDLGGSSAQDGVGGGVDDTKNRAGLPNSPTSSSSGKQQENSLVLLGQYSDDEFDDGSIGEQNQTRVEKYAFSDDGQVKLAAGQGNEDVVIEEQNDPAIEKADQLQKENASAAVNSSEDLKVDVGAGNLATESDIVCDENCLGGNINTNSTSDIQVGDATSGWKVVWHEESNQHYYWNIATGETSWEVQDLFVPAAGPSESANILEKDRVNGVFNSTLHNYEITEGMEHKVITETATEANGEDVPDDKRWVPDVDENHLKNCSPSARMHSLRISTGPNISSQKSDENLLMYSLNPGCRESCETGNISSRLIKHCELLLEQLNNAKGSEDYLHGHVHLQRYTFEAEMRLADIKSLACHEPLLLPFWEHSEKSLQQLEENINDFLLELKAEQVNQVASTVFPESRSDGINVNSSEKKAVTAVSDEFHAEVHENSREIDNNQISGDEKTGGSNNASGGAEMDMDVDMEVEDGAPSSNLTISVTSDQLELPTVIKDQAVSAPAGIYSVPPPPDEDWIPPPPPDDEPVPPPPPDEPPEISYPLPSDLASTPSYPYVEQYNVYPSSHFQYFTHTGTDVASSNLYAPTEECQPAVSQAPLYFEALLHTFDPAVVAVNPLEPGLYYGLQNGIAQPSVHNLISHPFVSLDTHGVAGSPLPKSEVDVSAVSGNSKSAYLEPASSEAPFQSSATISVAETTAVPSIPASTATVGASTTASKPHSKVPRNKKRTVAVVSSLKSNKKVSSLVNKWKAAKEELEEQEKEPENALEILERKRQREIEEWHKQQIASREAKDNANFQPLGGDWRERVKRKRAQLGKGSVQSPSDGASEVNPQPDLDELSKGLPRGWQAYWDDSSKQVYYGNTLTSETSWIPPI